MAGTAGKASETQIATRPQMSQQTIDDFWSDMGFMKNQQISSQSDAARVLSTKEIARIVDSSYDEKTKEENRRQWESLIASKEEILIDAKETIGSDSFYLVKPPFSQCLSVRAIPGHAQNGHSTFRGFQSETRRYPNTDIDTVLEAIEGNRIQGIERISTELFKNMSQQTIDDIVLFVENYFKPILKNPLGDIPDPLRKALDENKTPIGGLRFLGHQEIDTLEFMRGFYFASLIDNYKTIRSKVKQIYGHESGGGETLVMDKNKLMEYGLNINSLSEKKLPGLLGIIGDMEYEKGIELLTQMGIVKKINSIGTIDPLKYNWDAIKSESAVDLLKNTDLINQYIRYERGLGCGDDIAIFLSSFLPMTYSKQERKNGEISRFIGALMADKIDTIEKDARFAFPGGQDEFIGEYFNTLFKTACKRNRKFREKFEIDKRKDEQYDLLPQRTIVDFMAASANTRDSSVHSSQRWFYKEISGTCAISQYLKYMFQIAKERGGEIPSNNELRNVYKTYMGGTFPQVNLTFKQIPLNNILETMGTRYELIRIPSQRERKLVDFYSEKNQQ